MDFVLAESIEKNLLEIFPVYAGYALGGGFCICTLLYFLGYGVFKIFHAAASV